MGSLLVVAAQKREVVDVAGEVSDVRRWVCMVFV